MNRSETHQSKTMAVAPSAREENMYMAKLAKQAQRYEEMVEFMEKVSAAVESEEQNLLSMAYKNVIGARQASCTSSPRSSRRRRVGATRTTCPWSGTTNPRSSRSFPTSATKSSSSLTPDSSRSPPSVTPRSSTSRWRASELRPWTVESERFYPLSVKRVKEFEISLSV